MKNNTNGIGPKITETVLDYESDNIIEETLFSKEIQVQKEGHGQTAKKDA